ncbi:hypothetical protein [Vulgatibacter incomptus]|uniref:Uncharacterized protein n=1 Tax=Vulgatibacter incomptus TaxID=1391653 RepID=A0A0K1PI72_9BACT|nr:hypothetical protein [Vulgatibacter incomptus]AKU92809.1 hypothetical protein AKJ08_3196 [Vulgatibacter incomptus]
MAENAHEHPHHGAAEAEADRANVGTVGVSLAVMAIVLAVTSYVLYAYFAREAEAIHYSQVLSLGSPPLEQLRAYNDEQLGTAGVVDAEKGIYRIPVADGMKLFVSEARERQAAGIPQTIVRPAAAEATSK